ncbi:phosphatidylserine/phosphatidylglycerophosphate/cardiolipin synthase family protein [Nonomuraea sp. MG754425]|uniref:phospholipase D-like domain-containing protein n=1 Tax=Nonomuraea sp. MG754425 TaxID=2570319 RepID=UPI001F1EC2D9|nr:phospholipase D-like domain-containing protein [Nonomuraea sp. MG754425]MCF6475986.1 phosphatidylserine/phosphatidylglycerophosphate/cardiolipin synthase family protein [Nonomuraea sp. MG754425]
MPSKPLSVLAAGAAVVATAAVAFAGLAGARPAAAEASACADAPVSAVRTGAVFSEPVGGDPAAIVRTLCGLVRQTPAGESIQIAHFVMSGTAGTEFADALLEAHRRGVRVRVVLDGDQRGAEVAARLAAGLGTDPAARSWLHVCTGPMSGGTAACIGDKGQHNKFYLFSRVGRTPDVVVQSSANLTDLNSTTYWNNAVVLPGDRRLYAAYDAYFADLAAERKNLDYYRVVQTRSARAHFFPKAQGDPIVDSLDKVSCRRGAMIRVGMSEWDAYRVAIAERLRDLAGDGCRVQIVYGIMDDEVRAVLAAQPGVELSTLASGGALPGRVHSKYLLIEGSYDGDRDAHRVFTGSHNYNETSLRRNDETLLRLNDKHVYRQYAANFERMRAAAVS